MVTLSNAAEGVHIYDNTTSEYQPPDPAYIMASQTVSLKDLELVPGGCKITKRKRRSTQVRFMPWVFKRPQRLTKVQKILQGIGKAG